MKIELNCFRHSKLGSEAKTAENVRTRTPASRTFWRASKHLLQLRMETCKWSETSLICVESDLATPNVRTSKTRRDLRRTHNTITRSIINLIALQFLLWDKYTLLLLDSKTVFNPESLFGFWCPFSFSFFAQVNSSAPRRVYSYCWTTPNHLINKMWSLGWKIQLIQRSGSCTGSSHLCEQSPWRWVTVGSRNGNELNTSSGLPGQCMVRGYFCWRPSHRRWQQIFDFQHQQWDLVIGQRQGTAQQSLM